MQAYRKCGQPALPKYEDVLTSDGSVFRHGLPMSGSVRALLSQSVLQHEDSAFDARNDIHDLKLFPPHDRKAYDQGHAPERLLLQGLHSNAMLLLSYAHSGTLPTYV